MKRNMIFTLAIVTMALAPAAMPAASTDSETSSLSVTVGPEASFSSGTATTSFTGDSKFGAKTGTTSFSYKIRTSQSTGTGSVTVQITDFGTDGPATTDLTYSCSAVSPATACSSGQAVSTSTGTSVAAFTADAHSADAGDSGSVTWTLVDKTGVKTGTYTSTATFTISAT